MRRATREDADVVTALRLLLLAEAHGNPMISERHPDAARRARRLTLAQLRDPHQAIFVAHVAGEPVGVVRCAAARSSPLSRATRHAVLGTAYVVPAQRRTGVMRELVRQVERWCRARGIGEVRLRSGTANRVARAAWRALGFAPVAVVYRRALPAG